MRIKCLAQGHYCRCQQIRTGVLTFESLWSYPLSHNSSSLNVIPDLTVQWMLYHPQWLKLWIKFPTWIIFSPKSKLNISGLWELLWEKVWNNLKCLKRCAFQCIKSLNMGFCEEQKTLSQSLTSLTYAVTTTWFHITLPPMITLLSAVTTPATVRHNQSNTRIPSIAMADAIDSKIIIDGIKSFNEEG